MADPKSPPPVTCLDCMGTGRKKDGSGGTHKCPRCDGNGTENAPPSAEKLALRGEPTALTIIEELLPAASANGHFTPHEAVAAARAYLSTRAPAEEALIEAGYAQRAAKTALDAISPKDTQGPWGTALEMVYRTEEAVGRAALALPVEGRAPGLVVCDFGGGWSTPHERNVNCINPRRASDASHEKKLGKKGGGE